MGEAVAGGVTMVQLRDDVTPTAELVGLARHLVGLLAPTGVPLIVNNRIEVAMAAGAAGVHVGQPTRRPAAGARRLGAMRPSWAEHHRAGPGSRPCRRAGGLSGRGPGFRHRDQGRRGTADGLDGLAAVGRCPPLPIVAIGGIDRGNAAAVIAAGADGIAVVSAVCAAADPWRRREIWHVSSRVPGRGSGQVTAAAWLEERFSGAALDLAPRLALPARALAPAAPMASRSRPRPERISGRARITAFASTTATRCWPR